MKDRCGQHLDQRPVRLRRRWLAACSMALVLALANPAIADEYDEENAGHPLRLIAYILHPVGVLIDYVVMRPAHWLVSIEPMKTLFGHEE
ncbi:MAG: hypothetical protein VCB25_00310 [Myxococcota bacterium]